MCLPVFNTASLLAMLYNNFPHIFFHELNELLVAHPGNVPNTVQDETRNQIHYVISFLTVKKFTQDLLLLYIT